MYTEQQFYDKLPNKVFSVKRSLDEGQYLRHKSNLRDHKYISPNNDKFVNCIILDIDRPNSLMDWDDRLLPMPNIITKNKSDGKCHYMYMLKTPVYRDMEKCSYKPILELARIQNGYTQKLESDVHYNHRLTKNPLNTEFFQALYGPAEEYDFQELAEYIPMVKRITIETAVLEGRNVSLFNELRLYSYKILTLHQRLDEFEKELYYQAMVLNSRFRLNDKLPLLPSEMKSVVKSVAKWSWTKIKNNQHLFSKQRSRAKSSLIVRQKKAQDDLNQIVKLAKRGKSIKETLDKMGCLERTIKQVRKKFNIETYRTGSEEQNVQIYLTRKSGSDYKDIALEFGITESNARKIYSRINLRMKEDEQFLNKYSELIEFISFANGIY